MSGNTAIQVTRRTSGPRGAAESARLDVTHGAAPAAADPTVQAALLAALAPVGRFELAAGAKADGHDVIEVAGLGSGALLLEEPSGRLRIVPGRQAAGPDGVRKPGTDLLAFVLRGVGDPPVPASSAHLLARRADDHLMGRAADHYARWWEEAHRREGLRLVAPNSYSVAVPELGIGPRDARGLAEGRTLLLLHGAMAQTHSAFGRMRPELVRRLSERYGGRLAAFDHFTLSRTPGDNAAHLLEDLRRLTGRNRTIEIDVLAHSRGGLVARELVELADTVPNVNVRTVTFVATPNGGTPLCAPAQLGLLASELLNLLALGPEPGVGDVLDTVFALVKHLLAGTPAGIDGVTAMDPDSKRLATLNLGRAQGGVVYNAIASAYRVPPAAPFAARLGDAWLDGLTSGAPNDRIVPVDSVTDGSGDHLVPAARRLVLTGDGAVDHTSYWRSAAAANWLLANVQGTGPADRTVVATAGKAANRSRGTALRRDPLPAAGAGPQAPSAAPAATDSAVPSAEAQAPGASGPSPTAAAASTATSGTLASVVGEDLRVSLVHGSLEHADFPVMVGHYDDAPIRGAEGVIDGRLNGALSRRQLVGRYPRTIGDSVFIRARDGEFQYPVGVYVLGLGQTGELTKADLTTAVLRAVLDRCLRLHESDASRPRADRPIHVGISTVLMGSSLEAGGMAIDTSVAAIVDGVLRANVALARYEDEAAGAQVPRPCVRVRALQFVERYADRCEIASRALASLEDLLGVDRLESVTVVEEPDRREGALPARPPTAEIADTWSRFVVTASDAEREHRERLAALPEPAAAPVRREMELDISYLGRLARVDRALHRIDQLSVERLIERAMEDSDGDGPTATTLYELLFPVEFKREVAHATELHIVVDEFTANYPWELLAMRTQDGERRALSLAAGLLRQFREAASWRVPNRRPRGSRALVIGNPPTSAYPTLPGAAEEAVAVTGTLVQHGYEVTSLVWDDAKRFVGLGPAPAKPGPAILDALFEHEYRIVHIASHGEVVMDPDRPGELLNAGSGAIIGDDLVLTGTTVRQMPVIPELFFLNCCHLAKVGLNRLSAGIARTLMGSGVRAVVAAGWPVNDRPALRFATTFYEAMLGGDDYSTSVERGRARARDGSNTWAAYQCYGVPGFRLHTGRRSGDDVPRPPLTAEELVRRVETCTVSTGDLSRPSAATARAMREWLMRELGVLAAAAETTAAWATPQIAEALGRAYADLGAPDQAMRWYRKAVNGGARGGSDFKLSSLEQLANMEARHAQEVLLGRAGLHVHAAERTPAVVPAADAADVAARADGLFRSAAENLQRLITADKVTDERLALQASLQKKHAACLDPSDPERERLVRGAAEAYERVSRPQPYHLHNAAQLRAVLGEQPVIPVPPLDDDEVEQDLLTDQQPHTASYWSRAVRGDIALTKLMLAANERQRAGAARAMVNAYQHAFGARSSWRERSSSLDHLNDLVALIPPTDPRRKHLEEAHTDLSSWSDNGRSDDGGGARAEAATAAPRAASRGAGRRRRTSTVRVEALPAGYGDAILVDYTDRQGSARLLIDAGPAAEYKRNVRPKVSGTPIDLFVVTHVDADHIDGAIQLLLDRSTDIREIWFNGWKHLPKARGGKEGAMLDALLDGRPWNTSFAGGTIAVPETGPLPGVAVPGGAFLTILSPGPEQLLRLRRTWQQALERAGAVPGSAEDALRLLAEADRFEDTSRGGESGSRALGADGSVPNGSSIAFLFEFEEHRCLFTGDAHPDVLESSIDRLLDERGEEKLELDLCKLPHHGSRGNVSESLLARLRCKRFLVSTNGARFGHPDVEAIDLLRRVGGGEILLNDERAKAKRPELADLDVRPVVELRR